MKNNNKKVYTGFNNKKLQKEYKKSIKNSWVAKNIVATKKNKVSLIEKILKFFIMIILRLTTPRLSRKNKNKADELINKTYYKFNSKENAFIIMSSAFYFLVSFIPIITIVLVTLSIIPGYDDDFVNIILIRVIPGVSNLVKYSKVTQNTGAQLTSIILLFITSLLLSSNGFGKFIYSQNYIYNHENLGNWLINRLKGLLVVIFISAYLVVSALLYIFVYNAFKPYLNTAELNIYFYISFTFYLLVFLIVGFALLYRFSPSFKLKFSLIMPGVWVTVFPILIFIMSFGYLTSIIDYNKYGGIGTIMYIALFVSTFSYFIFLGIMVNEAYYKTYYASYTIAKRTFLFNKIKF